MTKDGCFDEPDRPHPCRWELEQEWGKKHSWWSPVGEWEQTVQGDRKWVVMKWKALHTSVTPRDFQSGCLTKLKHLPVDPWGFEMLIPDHPGTWIWSPLFELCFQFKSIKSNPIKPENALGLLYGLGARKWGKRKKVIHNVNHPAVNHWSFWKHVCPSFRLLCHRNDTHTPLPPPPPRVLAFHTVLTLY